MFKDYNSNQLYIIGSLDSPKDITTVNIRFEDLTFSKILGVKDFDATHLHKTIAAERGHPRDGKSNAYVAGAGGQNVRQGR